MAQNDAKLSTGCAFALMVPMALVAVFFGFSRACGGEIADKSRSDAERAIAEANRQARDSADERERADKAAEPKPASVPKRCAISMPGSSKPILLFPTQEGLDEWMGAGSDKGMLAAAIAGKAFAVAKGTECNWIDRGIMRSEVRVLDGSHAGQTGWVPAEWAVGAE